MAKKTRFRLSTHINNTPVHVNDEGTFSLIFDGETLTGTSVKELEEHFRKVRGVRKRKPLNLDVVIFVDEGWEESDVHRGTLLGYHAANGKLRMCIGGMKETINNVLRVHIVPARHKKLQRIERAWARRDEVWAMLKKLNKEITCLLDESGTAAHGTWKISIDTVLECEEELKGWIEALQKKGKELKA